MKRTPLQRKTPMRRAGFRHHDDQAWRDKPHLDRNRRRSKYARRERAYDYMGWVKTQECLCAQNVYDDPCEGPIEADHAGDRGLGQKAPDNTCVPLCMKHHRARTDMRGIFTTFDAHAMYLWRSSAVSVTQARAQFEGITIPDC
jgi:hypothetical protein